MDPSFFQWGRSRRVMVRVSSDGGADGEGEEGEEKEGEEEEEEEEEGEEEEEEEEEADRNVCSARVKKFL
ncbi:MAG TPA: hypothetical protein PKL54_15150 [Candidatus Hydrogenedentes bacterium]|nr:hypothetical protein [Candidatus Hydrogenedentota bacterium]